MSASNESRPLLVIVPAFNEQASIERVVSEIRAAVPDVPVVVIDDGSADATAMLAEGAGARTLAAIGEAALAQIQTGGGKLVNYQQLPAAVWPAPRRRS